VVNIRLDISYDGTKYLGWQRLGDSELTIQNKIEKVLERLVEHEVEIIGSGRTDAGVHARMQVANVHLDTDKNCKTIKEYLNKYLPEDISVTSVIEVDERFHARFDVVDKTYLYRLWMNENKPIFERKYVTEIAEKLNVNKMIVAAKLLEGTHDFKAFSSKSTKKSTIRTINKITIEEKENEIHIYVNANGFLYNMVRNIVGTLLEVGQNKREVSTINEIINKKDRKLAGERAPAKGVTLYNVNY
jgi:tRNA pseudouridine38-40 synthase